MKYYLYQPLKQLNLYFQLFFTDRHFLLSFLRLKGFDHFIFKALKLEHLIKLSLRWKIGKQIRLIAKKQLDLMEPTAELLQLVVMKQSDYFPKAIQQLKSSSLSFYFDLAK